MNELEKIIRKQIALDIMDENNPIDEFLSPNANITEDGTNDTIRISMKIMRDFCIKDLEYMIKMEKLKNL